MTPVTRVLFDGKLLDFELDSGEQSGSQLWTRFADDFATLLKERGSKSKKQVTEVGGSKEREIIELPGSSLKCPSVSESRTRLPQAGGQRVSLWPSRHGLVEPSARSPPRFRFHDLRLAALDKDRPRLPWWLCPDHGLL